MRAAVPTASSRGDVAAQEEPRRQVVRQVRSPTRFPHSDESTSPLDPGVRAVDDADLCRQGGIAMWSGHAARTDRERERRIGTGSVERHRAAGPLDLPGTGSLTLAAPPAALPAFQISADFRNVEDGMPSATFSSNELRVRTGRVRAPAPADRAVVRARPGRPWWRARWSRRSAASSCRPCGIRGVSLEDAVLLLHRPGAVLEVEAVLAEERPRGIGELRALRVLDGVQRVAGSSRTGRCARFHPSRPRPCSAAWRLPPEMARDAAAGRISGAPASIALRRLREADQLGVHRGVRLELEIDVDAAPAVGGRGLVAVGIVDDPWSRRSLSVDQSPPDVVTRASAARAQARAQQPRGRRLRHRLTAGPLLRRAGQCPSERVVRLRCVRRAAHAPPRCPRSAASRGSTRDRIHGRPHRERPSPAPRPEPHLLRGARPDGAPPAEPNPRREGSATRDFRCVRGARRPLRLRTGCRAWPGRRRR